MTNMQSPEKPAHLLPSIVRPEKDIQNLIHFLKPAGNMLLTEKSQIINYYNQGERQCYILHKGSVVLFRGTDGTILNTERAPFLFGISNQMSSEDNLFIRTQENCKLSAIPINKANEIIRDNDLWESMTHLLIYTSSRVYDHCAKITKLSSYEIIRAQLIELMNENLEIRYSTSVISYIQSRTFLSRSGIMRILSQLRTGGYIEINHGLLVSIHNLPLKY